MTTLHLVRRSAFETQDFYQCLALLKAEDALVLLDDGCYNLHHQLIRQVKQTIYVIKEHAIARAININTHIVELPAEQSVEPISMTSLVQMTLSYNNSITWQ